MGKNNKARRAAKAKKRAKDRKQAGPGGGTGFRRGDSSFWSDDEPWFSQRESTSHLLYLAGRTIFEKGDPSELLDRLLNVKPSILLEAAEVTLSDQVSAIWGGGWQPAELVRQGRRDTKTAAAGRLTATAIAVDNAGRRASTLDARWMEQIDRLDLPITDGKPGWVRRWMTDEMLTWPEAVPAIVDAIRALSFVPRLQQIIPPPGSPERQAPRPTAAGSETGAASDPVLEKIRNMLAKAESTEFEAEATAFTAKAQELMTRHAIDSATITRDPRAVDDEPIIIRVPIDPPYVDAKGLLLHVVAEANRCRAIAHTGFDMSSIVGFEADITAVEILFTSLLVQAQTALADAARRAPAGTRVRSQSYRSSFLRAFADRIGDRLHEINKHVFDEAEAAGGSGFQLVLRARSSAVDDAIDDIFGELSSGGVRGGYDGAGYASGRIAADQAQLNFGDLTSSDEVDIDLTDSPAVEAPPLPLDSFSGQ